MTKLTQTQTIILSRAAARPGALALPLPERLAGAAANMAVARMIELGWLEEVDADIRRSQPLWRETGDGHGTTLIATEAGLAAIGIEPVVLKAVAGLRAAASAQDGEPTSTSIADAPKPAAIRTGTKQAQIIALLQRPEGAAIAEIAAETGWQAHSVRGMISGALKKTLGLPITSEKVEGRGTVYRIGGRWKHPFSAVQQT